jgi:hypothetical protein
MPEAGRRRWLVGAALLATGVYTLGTGVYFTWLRPPMLPEDARFTGVAPELLPLAFRQWLSIVFATLGGFLAGFGLTLGGAGAAALTGRVRWLWIGIGAGSIVAFARFSASNLLLHSDFLTVVLAGGVLAVITAVLACFRGPPLSD